MVLPMPMPSFWPAAYAYDAVNYWDTAYECANIAPTLPLPLPAPTPTPSFIPPSLPRLFGHYFEFIIGKARQTLVPPTSNAYIDYQYPQLR